jgi:hypothetical protein
MKGSIFRVRSVSLFVLIKLLLSATNHFYPNEARNLFRNQGNFEQPWRKKFQDLDTSPNYHTIKIHRVFSGRAAIFQAALSYLSASSAQVLRAAEGLFSQFYSRFLRLILEGKANCNFFATFINYTKPEWFTKPLLSTQNRLSLESIRR